MGKRFRMSTALDVDDMLLECVPYAVKLANEKYQFDPPLTIHEIDRWGKLGTRADVIFEYFDDPEFFKNQPRHRGCEGIREKAHEDYRRFYFHLDRAEVYGHSRTAHYGGVPRNSA